MDVGSECAGVNETETNSFSEATSVNTCLATLVMLLFSKLQSVCKHIYIKIEHACKHVIGIEKIIEHNQRNYSKYGTCAHRVESFGFNCHGFKLQLDPADTDDFTL